MFTMPKRAAPASPSTPRRSLPARIERGIKSWSWLNLRLASAGQEWLRRRFTPAGQGVLAATFAAGLFGLDTRMTAAHQAFAFGVVLLAIAWLGTRLPLPKITLRRRLPRRGAVGQPCVYQVEVQNTGRRPAIGLTLHERLPDPRPRLATFLDSRAPTEADLNPVERLLGYPRWEWLIEQGRRAAPEPPVPLPDLAADGVATVELRLRPSRRGWLALDALVVSRTELLGLMHRERALSGPDAGADRLLVLPKRWPAPRLKPPGRRRLQPGGIEQAASVGDSREFIGLRDYLPGDSPRHIHWAAWARSGEPVVKEYRDEYFSRQALVLDTCPTPGDDPARFEAAVSVAASLLAPLGEQPNGPDGLLDLMLYADGTRILTAGRGLLTTATMLELLACIAPQPADHFRHLADTVTARAAQQSACLCVLLGWDDTRRTFVEQLRSGGLPVTVLVVASPEAETDRRPGTITVDPRNPGESLVHLR